MSLHEDHTGRYELGFPYRAWPNRAELRARTQTPEHAEQVLALLATFEASINHRFATDEDAQRVLEAFNGLVPLYRSVYRFTQFDPTDVSETAPHGRPVKKSAIVDKLFFEFEHHACGTLCTHVMRDVGKFINWLRRNDMEPWILFSGGKSLHVYVLFEPLSLRRPHDAVKRALKLISAKARLVYVDPRAMAGISQLARVLNAQNPKSRLYAIPLHADEVLRHTAGSILRLAQAPREPLWTPVRSEKLHDLLLDLDRRAVVAHAMDDLFPPQRPTLKEGEMCSNVEKAFHAAPDHDARGHNGVVALLLHFHRQGMGWQEAAERVHEWNLASAHPMSKGRIRYQAEWVWSNKPGYPPCSLVASFFGACQKCRPSG